MSCIFLLMAALTASRAHAETQALVVGEVGSVSVLATIVGPEFTLEAWVKVESVAAEATLFSAPALVGVDALKLALVHGQWRVAINRACGPAACGEPNTLCVGAAVEAGAIVHVAVAVNGRRVRLFIDGALAGTLETTSAPAVLGPWLVGVDALLGLGGRTLRGAIAEPRLWLEERVEEQVRCARNATLPSVVDIGSLLAAKPSEVLDLELSDTLEDVSTCIAQLLEPANDSPPDSSPSPTTPSEPPPEEEEEVVIGAPAPVQNITDEPAVAEGVEVVAPVDVEPVAEVANDPGTDPRLGFTVAGGGGCQAAATDGQWWWFLSALWSVRRATKHRRF